MIRAIAIDAEREARQVIEKYCNKTNLITLQKIFTNPAEALLYINKFPVDLIFLDIRFTDKGFYKKILENTIIIFTTAHSSYAVEAFNLGAIDYLLKPFSFERFLQSVNKALKIIPQNDPSGSYFFIRADYSLKKIVTPEILYIQGLDDFVKIHLTDKNPLVARISMKAILEKLPPVEFIQVHRSYIIPISKIKSIYKKSILLHDTEIPIGPRYYKKFSMVVKQAKK